MRASSCLLKIAGGAALLVAWSHTTENRLTAQLSENATRQDSVVKVWQRVYAYVRAVDRYSRPGGELPATLQPVIETGETGPDLDVWGRRLRYRPRGSRFEVRSAGSDGAFDSSDDIVAVGQLGRDRPCEVRDEFRVWTGVGFEPPCMDNPLPVLPRCPELSANTRPDDEIPATRWDSVQVMGLRLVWIARAVDGVGRDLGALPLTLRPVASFSRMTMDEIGDIWRRPIRFTRRGREFELRSPGLDGRLDTDDDIVVSASLGRTIPCAFRTERGMVTCEEPPPRCPELAEDTTASAALPATARLAAVLAIRIHPRDPRLWGQLATSAQNHGLLVDAEAARHWLAVNVIDADPESAQEQLGDAARDG
jgi:hypothetical protein